MDLGCQGALDIGKGLKSHFKRPLQLPANKRRHVVGTDPDAAPSFNDILSNPPLLSEPHLNVLRSGCGWVDHLLEYPASFHIYCCDDAHTRSFGSEQTSLAKYTLQARPLSPSTVHRPHYYIGACSMFTNKSGLEQAIRNTLHDFISVLGLH